jgi:glycine/D-amino acid oxidase-like deaminating enzyme
MREGVLVTGDVSRITIETPIEFNDKLPDKVDVVVIGGGIIGTFSALYLARKGKRVLVCEKGRVAGEQSSRNWGWIRQHGRDLAELPIMIQSLRLWHEADRETNGQCGVVTAGTYYLVRTPSEMESYESWVSTAQDFDLDSRTLSAREAADLFSGHASQEWVGGVCTPSDARGEPWLAVPSVARLARDAGALFRESCAVRALDIAAGQIRGVVTEHGTVACEQVVLSGGVWSSIFARRHGIDIPQLTIDGTVAQTAPLPEFFAGCAWDEQLGMRRRVDGGFTLALGDRNGFCPGPDAFRHFRSYLPVLRKSWRSIDFHIGLPAVGYPDAWGTPRTWHEDQVSPFERTRVLEPPPNRKYVRLICDRFEKRFPDIGRPKILNSWAGLIDSMPDVVPVVDRVPTIAGLIIATGMCGHGFGIGPGFGRVVARMIAGEDAEHDLTRFRFERFSDGSELDLRSSL